MRKKKVSLKTARPKAMSWLPLGVTAFLAIVLVAKWSLADWFSNSTERNVARVDLARRSLKTELLADRDMSTSLLVQNGIWSVADSIWNFENRTVFSQQLDLEMRNAPEGTNRVESDLPDHLALLDLIPAERASVEQVGGLTHRTMDFGSVRACVCYREADGLKTILFGKVANQQDDTSWQLITLSPRMQVSEMNSHLLPIAGADPSACQRWSKSRCLQSEILETNSSMQELIQAWQASGWLLQPISLDGEQPGFVLNCVKGQEIIHVRATPNQETLRLTLVLTALHSL